MARMLLLIWRILDISSHFIHKQSGEQRTSAPSLASALGLQCNDNSVLSGLKPQSATLQKIQSQGKTDFKGCLFCGSANTCFSASSFYLFHSHPKEILYLKPYCRFNFLMILDPSQLLIDRDLLSFVFTLF